MITKGIELICWGSQTAVANFMAIHPTVVRIFQTGTNFWSDRQTLLAWHLYIFCITAAKCCVNSAKAFTTSLRNRCQGLLK